MSSDVSDQPVRNHAVDWQSAPVVLRGHQSWKWYRRFSQNPLKCVAEAHDRFGFPFALGSPVPFSRGGRIHVLAAGAEVNRQVLSQPDLFHSHSPIMRGHRDSAHRRLRPGIFTMNGEEHRCHRRIMQQPFAKSTVASYTATMAGLIDQFIDRWSVGKSIDMYDEMIELTNWVASNILYGNKDFATSVKISRLVGSWLQLENKASRKILRLKLPGTAYKALLQQAEILETEMLALIKNNREEGNNGNDVLSLMVRAADTPNSGMSNADLTAHLVILYAAGYLTTANVVAWAIFLIAQFPSIAAELDEELKTQLADWPPDREKLESLPVLNGVVHEALRLLPPVPHAARIATQPVDVAGIPLKRRDKVLISAYFTHRDPEVFPNPDQFDPSRWRTIKPGPYEFIPFSGGSRLCLGYSFALLEMKLIVARIMQRYRIGVVPHSHIDLVWEQTLKPKTGIPMVAYSRDEAFATSPVTGDIVNMIAGL